MNKAFSQHCQYSPCLVLNIGSSTVKLGLFDLVNDARLWEETLSIGSAPEETLEKILQRIPGIVKNHHAPAVKIIGHRIAHGGAAFKQACLIDETVIDAIEACIPLAPQHNPPALAGIRLARDTWPDVPQVGVFDTGFHQTIPDYAATYAVPEFWRKLGIRRYGFHGISHQYIMHRAAQQLGVASAELKIVSCHLGSGASVCAIDGGLSVDTSMGMTALEGLIMGTRCGDMDPGIFAFLAREAGLNLQQIEQALYRDSGLKALSGVGGNAREIETQAERGNAKAQLALHAFAYRVCKYIGAYTAAMGGIDVLAFTGGIGENSSGIRERICHSLGFLGIHIDKNKNQQVKCEASEVYSIHRNRSLVKVMVMQSQEAWMIARESVHVCSCSLY